MASIQDNPFPIFLTTKEAAGLLKFSAKYFQNMVAKKEGPPCYKVGTRLRFKKSDLLLWLDQKCKR